MEQIYPVNAQVINGNLCVCHFLSAPEKSNDTPPTLRHPALDAGSNIHTAKPVIDYGSIRNDGFV